jgi:hypothetical protein
MSKRFDQSQYKNLRPATSIPGMKLIEGHRVEVAEHRITGVQVFVLDRHEIIPAEDGFALSTGKMKIPPTSGSYRHRMES